MRSYILSFMVFILSLFSFCIAKASHIVGGEMYYVYLGDSTAGGMVYHNYQVSLSTYADCLNGQPEAIAQDNPAFFSVYDAGTGMQYEIDTNVYFSSAINVPVVFSNSCGSTYSATALCLLKKTFIQHYAFPSNAHGYVVSYQRCCRNAAIGNILNPGDMGVTYFCTIPPTFNNSAVFKNYPPQILCLNFPFNYDNSATDADGDSLSYGLCAALVGADDANIKPIPLPPPYDSVQYVAPAYSSQAPLAAAPGLSVDPVTGLMTGTPNQIGRYLVAVCCYEWRGGVLINTVRREFEFVVTECSLDAFHPFAGNDTIIMVGDSVDFHAFGGVTNSWTPATYLTDPTILDPVGYFSVAGNFNYILQSVSDSGCTGSDTINIKVLDRSAFIVPNGFTPNNDGVNDVLVPIPILGSTLISFKIYNRMGKLLYAGGPNDGGWDGTYNGKAQAMDVYSWEVTYYDNTDATRKARGNVTLIR